MKSKLKTMPWDENIWKALLRAAAYIPPTVRVEALIAVIKESEREAIRRGSEIVEERDLVIAAHRKVPAAYKEVSLQILREQGINVDKYLSGKV